MLGTIAITDYSWYSFLSKHPGVTELNFWTPSAHRSYAQNFTVESAAARLRAAGLVVDVESGYVGWPNQEAALKGRLTPQILADERLVRHATGDRSSELELPIAKRAADL